MCLIMWRPDGGSEISTQQLENAWNNNKDGAGVLSFGHDGTPLIYKSQDKDEYIKTASTLVKRDGPLLLHFRQATHGTVGLENVQPIAGAGIYVAHNGIISIRPPQEEKNDSDSVCFTKHVLSKFNFEELLDKRIKFLIELATLGSKLVVVNEQGKAVIYGEDSGHWHDGVWFSNHSYGYTRTTQYKTSDKYLAKYSTRYRTLQDSFGNWGGVDAWDVDTVETKCDFCGAWFDDSECKYLQKDKQQGPMVDTVLCDECYEEARTWTW